MVILCREGDRVKWMKEEPKYRTEKEENKDEKKDEKDMFVELENVILVGQDGRVGNGKPEKCVLASKSILASVRLVAA